MPPSVLLASASPRRRTLLSALGVDFESIDTNVDEKIKSLPPVELARMFAWKKAMRAGELLAPGGPGIRARRGHWIIIAADTIVAVGQSIYGKPRSRAEARSQLLQLSGLRHSVITGLVMLDVSRRRSVIAADRSEVKMRRLSREEIDAYVNSREPFGKAGSYAIQAKGGDLIASLKGDYYNVVGFPVDLFSRLAPSFGLLIRRNRLKALYRNAQTSGAGILRYSS